MSIAYPGQAGQPVRRHGALAAVGQLGFLRNYNNFQPVVYAPRALGVMHGLAAVPVRLAAVPDRRAKARVRLLERDAGTPAPGRRRGGAGSAGSPGPPPVPVAALAVLSRPHTGAAAPFVSAERADGTFSKVTSTGLGGRTTWHTARTPAACWCSRVLVQKRKWPIPVGRVSMDHPDADGCSRRRGASAPIRSAA